MFDSWTGATTGTTNPLTITMNDNKTLTAKFKVKRDTTIDRNTNQTYTFSKGFPAKVEVYAFGAGGGGAGGSRNYGGNDWDTIVGGAGGGGAATYAEFNISSATTFNITVGEGGSGGNKQQNDGGALTIGGEGWYYGYSGTAGGLSKVVVGSVTINAGGGGGGCGRDCFSKKLSGSTGTNPAPGGAGGTGSWSGSVSSPATTPGKSGTAGDYYEKKQGITKSIGGSGGSIINVPSSGTTISAGKGGDGGHGDGDYGKGIDGGNGRVIIRFTWWE